MYYRIYAYGRGKRIKNIEHVLPSINNISKAKRGDGDRGKVSRELNGDRGLLGRGRRPQGFAGKFVGHPVDPVFGYTVLYIYIYI